jgi:hypothetical protein
LRPPSISATLPANAPRSVSLCGSRLKDLGKELKVWLGTLMVVVATLLFAALHYIPPTGHG